MSRLRRVPRSPGKPATALSLVGCLVALLSALPLLSACRSPSPEDALEGGPNVVLVVLCSLSFDRLGAAGYPRDLTPYLDDLAARGVFFENAVSSSSWTKPSAASLLTGLTADVHGMLDYYPLSAIERGEVTHRRVLSEELVTLPEALGSAGYDTFCRVNNAHAGKFFNLTQGCRDSLTRETVDSRKMLGELEGWIGARDGDGPFFAYLFDRDAHSPYDPPYEVYRDFHREEELPTAEEYPEYRSTVNQRVWDLFNADESVPQGLQRQWIDLYDAQLAALDRSLAGLDGVLERSGVAGETLIVVTADHGERFFEHGGIDHGRALDEPVVKIPLIFAGPGIAGGQRRSGVVRSIDLFPTLAALAGAETPPILQGRSLVPLLTDPEARLPEVSALSSFDLHNGRIHTLRRGRYKLLVGPGGRPAGLYDLQEDPLEHRDLLESEAETVRRLRAELRRWLEGNERLSRWTAQPESRELPPEVVDELRALGYL